MLLPPLLKRLTQLPRGIARSRCCADRKRGNLRTAFAVPGQEPNGCGSAGRSRLAPVHLAARLDHVLEGAEAGARRADKHGHVAGAMLVLPHAHMRFRNLLPGEDLAHARIDAPLDHELVGLARLLEMGEMRALDALLMHPHIARVHGEVVASGAGAKHDHAAALHHETGNGEGRFARMLEHAIDIYALAGDLPDRLPELAHFLVPGIIFGRANGRHLAPAIEVLAIDDALGAERHDEVALLLVGHDADGVRT